MLLCQLGHVRILFDSGNRASQPAHLRGEITRRRSHFQYFRRTFLFNPFQNLSVTAVWIGLLINVMVPSHVVFFLIDKSGLVQTITQSCPNAIECVAEAVNVTDFIPVISRNGPLDYSQSGLMKLNQDICIKMPFIGIEHEWHLLECLTTI